MRICSKLTVPENAKIRRRVNLFSGIILRLLAAIKEGLAAATILNDGKYQAQLGLAMSLAAKEGKLDVKSCRTNIANSRFQLWM
jgi:hypothetical protein